MRIACGMLLAAFAVACASDAGTELVAAECRLRCPPADDEDCRACIENIGRCCYPDDPTIGGQIDALAWSCGVNPGCTACCDECAALSCDELLANHDCPNQEPAPTSDGALTSNAASGDDALECLVQSPLDEASLAENQALIELLEADPSSEVLVGYLLECALGEDQSVGVEVGGETLTFEGSAGLAREWADAPCDEACQEAVSACLLARVNYYGMPVIITLNNESLEDPGDPDSEEDDATNDVEEGAFYGNFFANPPRVYACRGRGYDPFYQTVRLCAQRGGPCGIQVVGTCGDFDGAAGLATDRRACEAYNEEGGYYENCHNMASLPGSDAFPVDSRAYPHVVTVTLPRSNFMPGRADECFDAE